jgi:hypothetical protein
MVSKVNYRPEYLVSLNGSITVTYLSGGLTNIQTSGGGGGSPGAPSTSVQYNNAGAFAGNANFTYDSASNTLTTGNITGSGPAVGLLAPPLTIQPRVPTVAEVGGALNLFTPNAVRSNSAAGQVNLVGGNGLGTGAGGNSVLRGGNGGTDGPGGGVNLFGGFGNGTGNGGSFGAVGGTANGSGNGGLCTFTGGGALGSGNGGDIRFRAGTSNSGNGGSIEFLTQLSGGPGIPKIFMSMGGGSDGVNDVPGEFEVYSSLSATTIFKCSVDIGSYTGTVGFFGATPVVKPNITGSRSGNAALASFLSGLNSLGLVTDSTTAGTAPSGSGQTAATIGPVPYNTQYAEVTVTDANITATSKINISWGNITDADENTPDMSQVYFQAVPSAGSMKVRLSSVYPLDRLGGLYKINYLIG